MGDKTTVKFAEFILNHKWLTVTLSVILMALASAGLKNTQIKTDYRTFFSKDNPQMLAFEELQNTYDKADNILIVMTPKDGDVFTKQTLSTVQWATEQAWQAPFSTRVDSVTNFQHTWTDPEQEDNMIVKWLLCMPATQQDLDTDCSHEEFSAADLDALTDSDLETIADVAVSDPQLLNRLISPDRSVTAINITAQLPEKALDEVPQLVSFVRDLQQQIMERDPNIEVRLTGIVMMNNAFGETGQNDMETLLPIMMFLVVPLALIFMLRSFSGTVATMFVIIFSITAGMGTVMWMGFFLNGPLFSAPVIILTMAVADAVHLLVTFLQNMRRGMAKYEAMVDSLRINMMPIFLTTVTTIIGFLTMNFSEVPPLRDLGNTVAVGVGFAFIFSVTFLPALMMVLPVRVKQRESSGSRAMEKLGDFVVNKRKVLLPTMVVISIAVMAFLPKNELNDEFVKYFDETIAFRVDSDYTADNLTGLYTVFYNIKSGEAQGINSPEFLNTVERFVEYAKAQPEVLHVQTYTDVIKRLNKNMHADDDDYYAIPDDRELAAQYTLLYEFSLPKGLDLNNQLNQDKSATRIQMSFKNLSSIQVIGMEDRFQAWLDQNAGGYEFAAASPTLMFSHIGQRNINSMLTGTAWALVLISLILIFALRSLKLGVVSLIPNLVPMAVAFGIWGMFMGMVGMGLSVVTGMTLGIVVDDTVHFLSKYLRARREKNLNSHDAVRYAFNTVGMALTVTSVVLVLGFFVLGMSHYVMNSHMGIMTGITIAVALIIDFLLLPPILMMLEEKKDEKSSTTAQLADANS